MRPRGGGRRRRSADRRARPFAAHLAALRRAGHTRARLRPLDPSAATGSPRVVFVDGAPRHRGDPVAAAARHLRELGTVLTTDRRFVPEFVTDLRVERGHGGLRTVHFQQVHLGLPIVGMTRTVRLHADGSLHSFAGDSIACTNGAALQLRLEAAGAAQRAGRAVLAALRARSARRRTTRGLTAAARAALACERRRDGADFGEIARASGLDRLESSAAPGHSERFRGRQRGVAIEAKLVFVPRRRRLALAWEIRLQDRRGENHYAAWIAAAGAGAGAVLGLHDHAVGLSASGWVYRLSPQPGLPELLGFPDRTVPLPFTLRGGNAPTDHDWLEGGDTRGPFVESVMYEVAKDRSTFVPAGAGVVFDARSRPQALGAVQVFYFCSWLHDFFERLGFGRLAGSLERGDGGGGGDPLLSRVRDVPNIRGAWLVPAPDGRTCVLFTGPDPDTGNLNALDCDTVYHEYTHAVTQRMVGGPGNVDVLREPQSAGLAEGWSDYFALTLKSIQTNTQESRIGVWTSGNPDGARSHPYEDAFAGHARFGSLGSDGWTEPHQVGEVWAATLLAAQRALVAAFPGQREWSYALLWQVVFDSLALLPANPTFLEARDAMLTALGAMKGPALTQAGFDTALGALWGAFAMFGLGIDARCNGPGLVGIVESRRPGPA